MQDADIGKSLSAAQTWLRGLSVVLRQRDFSERSLQCLLGLWISERALESTRSDGLHGLAGVISEQLAPLQEAAISSCDSKLLLLALYIVRKCGYPAYALENYGRKVADALRQDAAAHDDHVGEAIVLARLGLSNYPCGNAVDLSDMRAAAHNLLHSDPEAIRSLYARICAATHFGTQECRWFPGRQQMAFVIRVLLIDALNGYDMSTGAMLLRLAAYLGPTNEAVIRDAQSFLRLQQLSDGRFGQYDLHAEALRDAGLDARLDLYLPLTVSCVWALAETAMPGFRLFSLSPLEL
ncbi:MAG: hypothetical protein ACHQRJ_19770 [Alphaproteobacteria bacterium]